MNDAEYTKKLEIALARAVQDCYYLLSVIATTSDEDFDEWPEGLAIKDRLESVRILLDSPREHPSEGWTIHTGTVSEGGNAFEPAPPKRIGPLIDEFTTSDYIAMRGYKSPLDILQSLIDEYFKRI